MYPLCFGGKILGQFPSYHNILIYSKWVIKIQQLKIRDFSSRSLPVHGHSMHPSKHKFKLMCIHVYSYIHKHMCQNPFSFPGCVPRGTSSTLKSAAMTSSPCLALRISQQDITNFSGPVLVVSYPFCPGHPFQRTGTETICRGGF